MAMRFDPAGQDQLAGRINRIVGLKFQAKGSNLAVRDADIGVKTIGRGGDLSAFYHQII